MYSFDDCVPSTVLGPRKTVMNKTSEVPAFNQLTANRVRKQARSKKVQ